MSVEPVHTYSRAILGKLIAQENQDTFLEQFIQILYTVNSMIDLWYSYNRGMVIKSNKDVSYCILYHLLG